MVIFQVLVYPCRTPLSGASGFLYIIRDFPKKNDNTGKYRTRIIQNNNGGKKMKSTGFRSIGKRLSVKLIMIVLCLTLVCSSIAVFAMPQVADEDRMGHGNDGMGHYYSAFSSNEELQAETKAKNIELASEGAILLKNGGGVNGDEDKLPYTDMKNISVFGINSDAFGYGGTGSGSGQLEEGADIYTSFEAEGLSINPKLKELYMKYSGGSMSDTSGWSVPTYEDKELALDYYTPAIEATYDRYNDAAFVVIGRLGGEGADLAVENVDQRVRPDKNGDLIDNPKEHYLELTYREEQLIKYVEDKFEKVVILFNSGNIIEFGELEDDPNVDAIVHIGQTGDYGFRGILKVLKGEVNPSGRTVDIYTRDFMVDPVMQNFGNGAQYDDVYEGAANVSYYWKNEEGKSEGAGSNVIEYEEGIYLGYKYYETMYDEIKAGNVDLASEAAKAVLESEDINGTGDAYKPYTDADDWYDRNVVYPFGYGLSYTTFDWSDFTVEMSTPNITTETTFTATVTVTNTGDVAGKDVVEIYMEAPYVEYEIEKATVSLVGFAKTDTLAPGESQEVTVTFDAYDIAAYDWAGLNDILGTGYEIDGGRYIFYAAKNSHDAVTGALSYSINLTDLELRNSQYTGVEVDNVFVDPEDEEAVYNYASISPTMTIMSRADMIGTFPKAPTLEERTLEAKAPTNPLLKGRNENLIITEEEIYKKINWGFIFGRDDDAHEIWATDQDTTVPEDWTQAADDTKAVTIRLADLMGYNPYDEVTKVESDNAAINGKTAADAWTAFMNQLTYEELKALNSVGFFKTQGIDRVGKEEAVDADGPCTIGGQTKDGYIGARGPSGTRYWCSAQMLAATWNQELAREQGDLFGEEGMWNGYNGWYAPSMNTHRSPFSGRNFEYYSQDGVHAGLITANVIAGVSARGVYPYIKHMALNDQETNRNNVRTWADEQTIREIYLRPYQYAVTMGDASGVMAGFNCIGVVSCPENYPLMTQILREEWGFDGSVVTDYQVGTVGNNLNNLEVMHRAGNNIPLGDRAANARGSGTWDPALRGGKGGVKVGKWDYNTNTYSTTEFITSDSKNDPDFEDGYADRQYYYTRVRATEVMYNHMCSNAIDNGADFQKNFAAQTINLPAGVNGYTATIETGFDEDADVKYELVEDKSKLPSGVTFNASNMQLTARNAAVGSGTVAIKAYYDGWANKTVTFNIVVGNPITFTGSTTVATGANYSATVSQNYWEADPELGANEAGIVSTTMSATGLPEGLSFDAATGAISGTASKAGVYNVEFNLAVVSRTIDSSGRPSDQTANYKSTVTITVGTLVTVTADGVEYKVEKGSVMTAPEAPEAPVGQRFVGWYVGDTAFDFSQPINDDVELTAKFEMIPTSVQFRVENGMIQASVDNGATWVDVIAVDELKGEQGEPGEQGPQGEQGEPGKDAEGCGSFVGTSSMIVVAAVLGLAFVGLVIAKAAKKHD